MTAAALIATLDLPASTLVDQRVPKKLLVENGAPTAADKRHINDGIEEIQWWAALKPNTIGVPEHRDELREYVEIAVLRLTLRPEAKAGRLIELTHRAVPYPAVLVSQQEDQLTLSLAHKRWSQGEAGKVVLDGDLIATNLGPLWGAPAVGAGRRLTDGDSSDTNGGGPEQHQSPEWHHALNALSLTHQPRQSLYTVYQGWIDTLLAIQAAQITGVFSRPESSERATDRHLALQDFERLQTQIATLRNAATKEKQLSKQVELNLEVKRLQAALSAARAKL